MLTTSSGIGKINIGSFRSRCGSESFLRFFETDAENRLFSGPFFNEARVWNCDPNSSDSISRQPFRPADKAVRPSYGVPLCAR